MIVDRLLIVSVTGDIDALCDLLDEASARGLPRESVKQIWDVLKETTNEP